MAHHVYQTEAFVLKCAYSGESNRFVDIFTRELGLVRAVAQSARLERSKMRYSLQDYTHLDISLVRGREVWRITGASEKTNTFYSLRNEGKKQLLLAKIVSLLRRLLHGEEKNEALFDTLFSFTVFLSKETFTDKTLRNVELLTVLRILYHLGYVANNEALFETNEYTKEFLEEVERNQKKMIREINTALQESQL